MHTQQNFSGFLCFYRVFKYKHLPSGLPGRLSAVSAQHVGSLCSLQTFIEPKHCARHGGAGKETSTLHPQKGSHGLQERIAQ